MRFSNSALAVVSRGLLLGPRLTFPQSTSLEKHSVSRALDASRAPVEDVRVDHRRAHVVVAKQLLDGADIVALLQQVGGERMAEGVACSARARTIARIELLLRRPYGSGRVTGALRSAERSAASCHLQISLLFDVMDNPPPFPDRALYKARFPLSTLRIDEDPRGRARSPRVRSRPDPVPTALRGRRPAPRETRRARSPLPPSQSAPAATRSRSRARPPLGARRTRPAPCPGEYRDRHPLPEVLSWRLRDDGFGNPEL